MADTMSRAARSALMSRIRGDALGPETRMAAALSAAGVKFDRNPKGLPGRPDFVCGRLAVFVHGCFWHCCPAHWRLPKSGAAGWAAKFAKNRARDRRVRRQLNAAGYRTAVVWEHDLKTARQAAAAAERVRKILIATKQAVC